MKKYLTKNFKGNITETLAKFQAKFPGEHVKSAKITNKGLVIESLLDESRSGIKSFSEVMPGDIGKDYNGLPCVILKKGTASTIEDPNGTFEGGAMGANQPSVLVQMFTGEKIAYVYDASGVTVRYEDGNIENINRSLVGETGCGIEQEVDETLNSREEYMSSVREWDSLIKQRTSLVNQVNALQAKIGELDKKIGALRTAQRFSDFD